MRLWSTYTTHNLPTEEKQLFAMHFDDFKIRYLTPYICRGHILKGLMVP